MAVQREREALFAEFGPWIGSTGTHLVPPRCDNPDLVVSLQKHIFEAFVVLQYNVTNMTAEEQPIQNVSAFVMDAADDGYKTRRATTCARIAHRATEPVYTVLQRPRGATYELGRQLRHLIEFNVRRELVWSWWTFAYERETDRQHRLEPVAITLGDFLSPLVGPADTWQLQWDKLGADSEQVVTFGLMRALDMHGGVQAMLKLFNTSEPVDPIFIANGQSTYVLRLRSVHVDTRVSVFMRVQLRMGRRSPVFQLRVRSSDMALSKALAALPFGQ